MNDKIKEILYWFSDEYPKEEKILEDYITNLQERIDKAVEYLTDEDRELLEDSYYKVSKLDLTEELLNILRGDE